MPGAAYVTTGQGSGGRWSATTVEVDNSDTFKNQYLFINTGGRADRISIVNPYKSVYVYLRVK